KPLLELPDDVALEGLEDQRAGNGARTPHVAFGVDVAHGANGDHLAVDGIAQGQQLAEDPGVFVVAGNAEGSDHVVAGEGGEVVLIAGGEQEDSLPEHQGGGRSPSLDGRWIDSR